MLTTTAKSGKKQSTSMLATGVLAAATLVLAGCSSGSADTSGGTASPTADTGIAASLATEIQKQEGLFPAISAPGPAVDGTKLKGKTVYYIPILFQTAFFHGVEAGLNKAVTALGGKVVVCDALVNPSTASQCLNQAASQNAAAVVTDSIAEQFAPNAYAALTAKKIPVVHLHVSAQEAAAASPLNMYVIGTAETNAESWGKYSADTIATDSNGQAHTLFIDFGPGASPTLLELEAGAKAEFAKVCPSCKTTIKTLANADQTLAASTTSAALLSDPSIKYIETVAAVQQGVMKGINDAGRAGKVKLVIGAGDDASALAALQKGAGVDFMVSISPYYTGWAAADQVVRALDGAAPIQQYVLPLRTLTKQNSQNLDATADGVSSSQWFGGGDFEQMYLKLWGAGS